MREVPVFRPYFDGREERLIRQALNTGWVAQGPAVAEFEQMVAAHEKAAFAVAASSGTTALHLALMAMGLSANEEVLVPSFTFVATANAVEMTGARAVFVDVETDTYNLDVAFLREYLAAHYVRQNGRTVNAESGRGLFGILAVHQFGLCANMPAINALAAEYHLKVLEDSACALGARIGDVHEGGFGNPACLSSHARKSITTGEGGMVLTNDEAMATKMRALRSHSASVSEIQRHQSHGFLMPKYDELGYNYRMTDIQGAMGVAQMQKFDEIVTKKRSRAARYAQLLPAAAPWLKPPTAPQSYFHTYQSYVVLLDAEAFGFEDLEQASAGRNRLMAYLEENGISTRQGTHACHMLGHYSKRYGYQPQDLPGAYTCDRLSIAIPLFAGLSDDDQDYVLEKLAQGKKAVC